MKKDSNTLNIAYFITAHGFGHAARSVAVMTTLAKSRSDIHFHIFTLAPEWFFRESLGSPFTLYPVRTDIGVIQRSPMEQDLESTLNELRGFLPFNKILVASLAKNIRKQNCRLVICDIAPIGIEIAKAAGIPSLLIENFTWDWIYEEYTGSHPEFSGLIVYLRDVFAKAVYHVQTQPVCAPYSKADLVSFPVSRKPLLDRKEIRTRLGIDDQERIVLITMGGIPESFKNLEQIKIHPKVRLVIPGGSQKQTFEGNLVLLPHHSSFYHPDLIYASDAVIGKAGYSTISEVYQAGVPFGFVIRDNFRESKPLEAFIKREISSMEISAQDYSGNGWVSKIPEILDLPERPHHTPNGADQIAHFLTGLI